MTDESFRISVIHAIIAVDDNDKEIIVMVNDPRLKKLLPLIATHPSRLIDIAAMAHILVDSIGKDLKIVRFSAREDVGEIKSKKP